MTSVFANCRNQNGFLLVGTAAFLVLTGIVASFFLVTVTDQVEHGARAVSSDVLEEARRALLVYAKVNGRLPYADIPGGDGEGDAGVVRGDLPYWELGVKPADEWHRRLKYEVHPGLVFDRDTTCATLAAGIGAGPGVRPSVWDEEAGYDVSGASLPPPADNPFPVAAIIVSGGPSNADGVGAGGDAIFDAVGVGDNISGSPYIRFRPTPWPNPAFDDLVSYIGATNSLDTGGNTLRPWLIANDARYNWETCTE